MLGAGDAEGFDIPCDQAPVPPLLQEKAREGSKSGYVAIDRGGGEMLVVAQEVHECLNICLLHEGHMGTGLFQVIWVEKGEGLQGRGIGDNGTLGAATAVKIVFERGYGLSRSPAKGLSGKLFLV